MGNYYRECTIFVKNDTAVLNEKLYLYKHDKNVELFFTVVDVPYNLKPQNLLKLTNVDYAQVKMQKSDGTVKKAFPIQPLIDDKVRLLITEELTDEDVEIGTYDFQIRLFNSTQDSAITLPIVPSALNILKPLFDDDDDNDNGGGDSDTESRVATVDNAKVDYSIVGGDVEKTTRNYTSKVWTTGEIIKASSLNNIENGIKTNSDLLKGKADAIHFHEEYVTNQELEKAISGVEIDTSNLATKTELSAKAEKTHIHNYSEIVGTPTIPTKTSQLTNDSTYITVREMEEAIEAVDLSEFVTDSELASMLSNKSNVNHTHKEYATNTSLTVGLANKSDVGHTHEDYVTNLTLTTELANKSNIGHTHKMTEIDGLLDVIGNLNSLNVLVVEELPSVENALENIIYLVPSLGRGKDFYDEYLFIEGDFELIGNTEIDLSDYVTSSMLAEGLSDKADKNTVDAQLFTKADKATITALQENVNSQLSAKADYAIVNNQLSTKADKTTVDTQLSVKADKTYVDTKLGEKADKTSVESTLAKKVDTTTLTSELAKKVDNTKFNDELSKKVDTALLNSELAKKADTTTVNSAITLKADKAYVDNQLATKATTTVVNAKADKAYVDSELAKKADTRIFTTTIPASGWSKVAPFSLTIEVSGILETDAPHITPVYTETFETDKAIQEAWNKISRITTDENTLTIYAFEEVPTREISIQVEIIR